MMSMRLSAHLGRVVYGGVVSSCTLLACSWSETSMVVDKPRRYCMLNILPKASLSFRRVSSFGSTLPVMMREMVVAVMPVLWDRSRWSITYRSLMSQSRTVANISFFNLINLHELY